MAVFTCAEMVEACLAGQDSGWKHFLLEYLPFAALLVERHYPQLNLRRETVLREVLLRARDQEAQFFREYQGHGEREFVLHLREHVLRVLEEAAPETPAPEIRLTWEEFERAFAPLTALERQAVWMFVLNPRADDIALMLRADQPSVDAILSRAQERLRASADHWSATMLAENGHLLSREPSARRTNECPDGRTFLRLLDGQNTWRERLDLERHLAACWYCVDVLCRFREVYRLRQLARPLSEAEAEPYARTIGLTFPSPARWKRLLGVE